MGFDNPIVGGTALRIPAIQSPDYSPGAAGWIIRIDGSAEFNNLTLRGEFLGAAFIINSAGIFLYDGTPAAGNLIGSWASVGATDEFGNDYGTGLTLYDVVNGSQINLAVGGGAAVQSFTPPAAAGVTWEPGRISAAISAVFGANTAELSMQGPYNTAHVSRPSINMFGSSDTQADNRIDMVTEQVRITGNVTAANLQRDTVLVSFVALSQTTVNVVFPNPYAAGTEPTVVANIDSGAAATVRWGARAINVTNTGFTLFVFKGDSGDPAQTWSNIKVQWAAYAEQ